MSAFPRSSGEADPQGFDLPDLGDLRASQVPHAGSATGSAISNPHAPRVIENPGSPPAPKAPRPDFVERIRRMFGDPNPIVVKELPREEARERARALLTKVGLGDRLDYYPSQLSGGQQQRAAIARALAMSPRAVLYDEPTSSLDPTLVNEVLGIMRQLHDEGMTQVVVTHEMRFARDVADTILFMHEGRVIESGPPADLFTRPRDPRTREFLKSFL